MGSNSAVHIAVRRLREQTPVWGLIAAISCLSLAIWLSPLIGSDPIDQSLPAPWWALAISFAIMEAFVVNLHFRSESGSFSLLEIPLVYGLLFASHSHLWIAIVIGSAVSLKLVRHQAFIKVVFNVVNLSLHVAIAAALFPLLLGDNAPLSPSGWLALFGATLTASVVQVLGLNLVIGIAEGEFSVRRAWNMIVFGEVVAAANTVQALIAILLVVEEPLASLLLISSTGMLFAAYRAYVSEREHREQVEFLYQSTKSLRAIAEIEPAVSMLLEEARSMFRAEMAELVLFPAPDSDDSPVRYLSRDGATTTEAVSAEDIEDVIALIDQDPAPLLLNEMTARVDVARDYTARLGLNEALMGVLRSDQRVIGLLVLGDRLGSVTSFTTDDLHLFENLVEQTAVALENDQLEQALSRLRLLETELSHQARFDVLTGLANRMLFTAQLEAAMSEEDHDEVVVLYIDLDDFKLVNDRLGHGQGDSLLAEVASRLKEVVRPTDLVARLGGDEFSAMIQTGSAEIVAHRIIRALSEPFVLGTDEARIGASIGLAKSTATGTAAELVHHADLAMYAAKQRGKGSVVWYSSDLQSDQERQQVLNGALRKAIADEEFEVVYQPIVRIADLAPVGAEALVRWRHGASQPLTPSKFIAEAERSGLILSIDRIVREKVFAQLHELVGASSDPFFVSLNISARNLQRSGFVDEVVEAIATHRADPRSLVLEVTESAFAEDPTIASAALSSIRELGMKVAIDDFGTGYSSLSYLRELPIDILKIAQPFVADLIGNADSSLVDVITRLAQTMSLEVVAEGVEQPEQLARLAETSCEMAQGFLFATPMPAEELIEFLRNPVRLDYATLSGANSSD